MTLETCDVVVIGAGFSGMYAIHRLRSQFNVVCFEAGDGVGGTWYWNRYPGCRVDVESVQYSYGFDDALQQEWHWPEYFSSQPDLERYANHVADRFNLREHIRFSNPVRAMRFDESEDRWHIDAANGDHVICRYVIAATGALYAAHEPEWPGRDQFKGRILHTTAWPREGIDFSGKRVGLIGTGSTGIQIAPIAAEQSEHLTVFQRTPAFSLPSGNRPLDAEYEQSWKQNYSERRKQAKEFWAATIVQNSCDKSIHDVTPEERQKILEDAWHSRSSFQLLMSFPDVMTDRAANDIVAEFARNKIRATVKDPAVAELLCPKTYVFGGKRVGIDNGYYQTFNRSNVSLVDVRTNPIVSFTPNGLKTTAQEYDLDIIILATGFDAVTGALSRIDISGVGGRKLADKWSKGPANYLGITISGFPNFFMIHGPQTPAAQAQMIASGEWQVNWVSNVIEDLTKKGVTRLDTLEEAEKAWDDEVERISHTTLHRTADSWYNGANIPGKVQKFGVYIGGFPKYTETCNEAIADDYRGFVRTSLPRPAIEQEEELVE